ncbi:MAG: oligosaccharide flippase family protein, partial [bacterium]|nr:oligosaccharide flippase family protein [bacterium]
MSILRQGFGVFVTRVWAAAAGLIMSIIIARSFGPEGKGIASLMLLVPVLLSTFGNAGLHISNVYFFGKKGASISRLASNSVWVALVLGLLVCGVGIAFYPLVGDRFFAGVPGPFLFTIVALTPAMLLSAYFGNLLLAQRRIAVFNTVMAVQTGVQLATLMIAIYFFDAGVIAVVLGLVVNIIIGALGMTALVYRADPFTWTFDRPLFKQTMLYGLKGYVANALQFLNYRSDILLVSFFLGATAVGWYSVAVNFAEILWYVPTSLGTILFPVVASSSIAN